MSILNKILNLLIGMVSIIVIIGGILFAAFKTADYLNKEDDISQN